jgi:protein SCO1/2
MPPHLRRPLLLAVSLVLLLALGLGMFTLYQELARRESGGRADIGGPFELVSAEGERIGDASFRGRHMLVYFGYTFCPDVCPTELAAMSQALDLLGGKAAEVKPVFISVDPARDTVAVLADYRQHFHPDFAMLTGSQDEIAAAAKAYKVFYAKAGDEGDPNYLMDHSSFVYLMDEAGRYRTHFGPQTTPEAMAARIAELL